MIKLNKKPKLKKKIDESDFEKIFRTIDEKFERIDRVSVEFVEDFKVAPVDNYYHNDEIIMEFRIDENGEVIMITMSQEINQGDRYYKIVDKKRIKENSLVRVKTLEEIKKEFTINNNMIKIRKERYFLKKTLLDHEGKTFITKKTDLFGGIRPKGKKVGYAFYPEILEVIAQPEEWKEIREELFELRDIKKDVAEFIVGLNKVIN